jgi:hypothetical protein
MWKLSIKIQKSKMIVFKFEYEFCNIALKRVVWSYKWMQ